MTVQSPCFDRLNKIDCPERSENCHNDCPRWAEYVKDRDKEYQRRNAANQYTEGHDKQITRGLKRKQSLAIWGGYSKGGD